MDGCNEGADDGGQEAWLGDACERRDFNGPCTVPSSKGIGDDGTGLVMDQELVLDAMEEASGFSSNISIQA
jgi:hypothetical protein